MERSCVHGLQDIVVKMALLLSMYSIQFPLKFDSICWRNGKIDPQIHMELQKFSQVVLVVNTSANKGDVRDTSLIPGSGRFPREGLGNALQYSYLENPMDSEAWPAAVRRVTKSRTYLKRLSMQSRQNNVVEEKPR